MNFFTEDSGGQFESIVLARCTWECRDYVPYKKSIEMIKQHQGCWNPAKPHTPTAAKLKKAVADLLGADYLEVKIFTALGNNPGDRYHGIDAIIEYQGKFCPIDLTVNPHKCNQRSLVVAKSDLFTNNDDFDPAGFRQVALRVVSWLSAS